MHIEAHSKDASLFELFAKVFPHRVAIMAKLSQPVVSEAKVIVRKRWIDVEFLLSCDTDL